MGTLAAAAAGGTPRPRPDQTWRTPPPAVVSPGGMAGTFRGRYVVVYGTGPNTGVFVYNGTPAAGNLIASIAAAGGTDPYGNAYLAGDFSYYPSGAVVYASGLFEGQVRFYTAATQAGPYTEQAFIEMLAVGSNYGLLLSTPSAAPIITTPPLVATGKVYAQAPGAATGTAETWHQAPGLPAGFTGSVHYQLLATGRVALSADLSIAASTSISHGETLATLQSGYYSTLAGKFIQFTFENNGVYSTVPMQVSTTGNLAWMGAAVTTSGTSGLNGEATIAVDI